MIRNVAGQVAGAQVTALDGAPFAGPVTCWVIGDGGTRTQGANGAGAATNEGAGYYTYVPTQEETDFKTVGFQFIGPNAIAATTTYDTFTVAQEAAIAGVPGTGVTAYSAIDFGTRALRLLGVVDAAAVPSAEDNAAAFAALNDMVNDWATQRQTIFKIDRSVFPLVSGQSTYTLGYGGDWNIIRPVWIERCSVIPNNSGSGNTGPMEIPIGPPLDISEFQRITIKTAGSSYPQYLYWDRAWVNGLSQVQVYPVPQSSNAAMVLYTPSALMEFPDMATQFTFPPGYAKAIRFNLAVELAPEYGIDVPDIVMLQARESKANIKRANNAPVEAQFDAALVGIRGRYNIYSDSF